MIINRNNEEVIFYYIYFLQEKLITRNIWLMNVIESLEKKNLGGHQLFFRPILSKKLIIYCII